MSGCGGPVEFARCIAKVGRRNAQDSLSVRQTVSPIQPPKATVAAPPCGNEHALPSRPRPIAVSTGCGTGTRRLIGLDKTMLIYVRQRSLTGWPSGTGSESELGFPSRPIPDRMATKNVQQENIFPGMSVIAGNLPAEFGSFVANLDNHLDRSGHGYGMVFRAKHHPLSRSALPAISE